MRFSKVLYVVLLYGYAVVQQWSRLMIRNDLHLPNPPDWVESPLTLVVWVLMLGLAAILVVVEAVRNAVRGDLRRLLRGMSWFKLALIPYFVWSVIYFGEIVLAFGLYGALLFLASAFGIDPSMLAGALTVGTLAALAAWASAAILIGLTYAAFLPTSADGIALLIALRRRRQIGIPAFILHLVLHLLFVTDLISTLILCLTYWKKFVSGADGSTAGAVEAPA